MIWRWCGASLGLVWGLCGGVECGKCEASMGLVWGQYVKNLIDDTNERIRKSTAEHELKMLALARRVRGRLSGAAWMRPPLADSSC